MWSAVRQHGKPQAPLHLLLLVEGGGLALAHPRGRLADARSEHKVRQVLGAALTQACRGGGVAGSGRLAGCCCCCCGGGC